MVSFEVDPAVGRFDINGGTSIAVPFVAGSFAILRGAHPEHTSATILSALQATGAPVTGGGAIREIRVHAALQGLTSPPVATPDPTPEPQPTPTPTLPG
jgi:hypothetical protein